MENIIASPNPNFRSGPSTPPPGAIHMDAFNLFEGAAILRYRSEPHHETQTATQVEEQVWVVTEFRDYPGNETVLVILRSTLDDANESDVVPLVLGYCQKVLLVGNVRNPSDFEDNNWGA